MQGTSDIFMFTLVCTTPGIPRERVQATSENDTRPEKATAATLQDLNMSLCGNLPHPGVIDFGQPMQRYSRSLLSNQGVVHRRVKLNVGNHSWLPVVHMRRN